VARWDGDTLVVETTGFNGKAWLDSAGHPLSGALHLTEKFRRPAANTELIEYVCNENEKDLSHLVGK